MEKELHFEHGDLTGEISVSFEQDQNLEDLCAKYINDYNRERFEPVALRIFIGKEITVTLYAADKMREGDSSIEPGRIPVKKFKVPGIPLHELFRYIGTFNCTLTTNTHPLESMQVMNK
ncbi:MAG TPA: hypothetical protein VHL77_07890 [Ferruginibacter sp.]|jgi:hypothetical protein|nr:hypothetical protein [Ferruginibacter sp.]